MRRAVLIAAATLLGAAAGVGGTLATRSNSSRGPVRVLVAAATIPRGTLATHIRYAVLELPADRVQRDAIPDPAMIVGRRTSTRILAGSQLVASDFR